MPHTATRIFPCKEEEERIKNENADSVLIFYITVPVKGVIRYFKITFLKFFLPRRSSLPSANSATA